MLFGIKEGRYAKEAQCAAMIRPEAQERILKPSASYVNSILGRMLNAPLIIPYDPLEVLPSRAVLSMPAY